MTVSVVIAVHNGGEAFTRCLAALRRCSPTPIEVIVVDDASMDGSGAKAAEWGARVIRLEGDPQGPAAARNRGAESANGDVIFFTDADVALHEDAIERAEETLDGDPPASACFGSYDTTPADPGFVSQYKNLVHCFVHQTAGPDAATFWAGCGAVRTQAFRTVGGFDAARFPRPSIEDIELGMRLRRAGYTIRIDRRLLGTHLKKWTFRGMVRSDIVDRAIPWSRLILESGDLPNDLNVKVEARLSTALVFLAAGAAAVGVFFLPLLALVPVLLCGVLAFNSELYLFLIQTKGWRFTAAAIPLHWLYFLYSGAVFGWLSIASKLAHRKH